MNHSTITRQTIQPYYKESTVFQRDEAYYTQMLTGTRRIGNGGVRQSSLKKSRSNFGMTSHSPSNRQQESNILHQTKTVVQIHQTKEYLQAQKLNQQLKRQMNELVNDTNDYGNTTNVMVMNHYTQNTEEVAFLKGQETRIQKLNQELLRNEAKITQYKKGADELKTRMTNIQNADKQIYKLLQTSVNRDRELLQRAASGLSRGQKRQDIARILQQIITT